jgi:hypothetical protein
MTSTMGFETYSIITGVVSVIMLLGVIIDQSYQRLSHKWTNEPPLLPYRIPIIGHALTFSSHPARLFKYAQYVELFVAPRIACYNNNNMLSFHREQFPNCQAFSLMLFGKRVYVRSSGPPFQMCLMFS